MTRTLKNFNEGKKLFNIISRMAFLLLRSGAEAARIEETIVRVGSAYEGFDRINCFAQYTAVHISVDYGEEKITTMERCTDPSTDLGTIHRVNALSRKFCNTDMTLQQAKKELRAIETAEFPEILRPIGSGLSSGLFTMMFGGSPIDFLASLIIGFVSWYVLFNIDLKMPQFFIDLFSGVIISIMALGFVRIGLGQDFDMIMIGVIMPYVPGAIVTSGIRDTLAGHHLTGIMLICKAIFIAFAIALGALIPVYTTM